MDTATTLNIQLTISFDNTLFVDHELLGVSKEIVINSGNARLEFPCEPLDGEIGLQPPHSSPPKVSNHLPEKLWGLKKDGHKETSIEACQIIVPVLTNLDFDLSKEQIGGPGLDSIVKSALAWFDSFTQWLWILTSQSLNPVYPDPQSIHRRSRNILVTASTADKASVPRMELNPPALYISNGGQASERLVNNKVLDLAILSAGTQPPVSLEMLASARTAARRRDFRRALVDAGSASEFALSELVSKDKNRKLTLGALVTEAQKRKLSIPDGTKELLVNLRNEAIHRGYIPTYKESDLALEIAEQIVALGTTQFIPASALKSVYRPQRYEIVYIKKSE